jgi:hypothetical protein
MESVKTIPKPPTKGKDRRRNARFRVKSIAYVDLGPDNGGTLMDVSEGGISFQGIQPLQMGQVLPAKIKLPGTQQSIKATGQITWLNESRKGGGMRFVELLGQTKDLLKAWISAPESDVFEEQPLALTPREEKSTHAGTDLGAGERHNRPSTEAEINLANILRDTSLSRGAVVAAIDASRSATTTPHATDAQRAPRSGARTWGNKSNLRESPAAKSAWRIFLILPLALVVLLGLALFQHYRRHTRAASAAVSGDPQFGLEAERVGKDWRVHWKQDSEVLVNAVSGHISIADGPVHKELDLDSSELRSGSIMYTPTTDDVVVRLQIVTEKTSEPLSESVRIVGGNLP